MFLVTAANSLASNVFFISGCILFDREVQQTSVFRLLYYFEPICNNFEKHS